jgi:hypothetical protein
MKIFNNSDETKKLGKVLNLPIDEIQLNENSKIVMYFWPNFWWFKHRSRMTLERYNNLMNNNDLTSN